MDVLNCIWNIEYVLYTVDFCCPWKKGIWTKPLEYLLMQREIFFAVLKTNSSSLWKPLLALECRGPSGRAADPPRTGRPPWDAKRGPPMTPWGPSLTEGRAEDWKVRWIPWPDVPWPDEPWAGSHLNLTKILQIIDTLPATRGLKSLVQIFVIFRWFSWRRLGAACSDLTW